MSIRVSDDGSSIYNGITVNTPYEDNNQGVKVEDFLQLMIAQLTNQDFMNPVDDTQYVTQLAQFATMQSMQEMNQYSQTNYVTSLVGKRVTVASYGLGGNVNKDTGIVSKVDLSGDEFMITVNDKQYKLSQIMNIADPGTAVEQKDIDGAAKLSPIVTKTTQNSISIRWEAPISDPDLAGELRYDVYYTDDGQLDFTNLSSVKKGELAAENLSSTEFDITGLTSGKTYFVTVVVTNKNGDSALYQHTAVPTK